MSAEDNAKDKKALEETKKSLEDLTRPIQSFADALEILVAESEKLNQNFGLSRARIIEMQNAVADSAKGIITLGGSIEDVAKTIDSIALGSRRNLIANEEVVSKLYAANKVLGISAEDLVESFGKVGYEASQIGTNLEDSTEYIQGLGLNARVVMKDVVNYMDQMNRFQFEGGVQGLTKMAAQASMLRFSMNETFQLADKVLNPEGAVEIASAFQRLGVTVGNLVDPFALMNQSIMDPSGLQNSLKEVAKSFTYFDKETQSFKINERGVLTLRELQTQTGVSAAEMSKLGLAAADLDKRISQINAAGLSLASEEDKQYLANIATVQNGKYVVTLEDGTKKELAELTQPELDKLIEQQKTAPKGMEEIARSQLSLTEQVAYNTKGTLDALKYGVASNRFLTTNVEGGQRVIRNTTDALRDEVPNAAAIREKTNKLTDRLEDLFNEQKSGKIGGAQFDKKLRALEDDISSSTVKMGISAMEGFARAMKKGAEDSKGDTFIENEYRKLYGITQDQVLKKKASPITNESVFTQPKKSTQQSSSGTFDSNLDVSGQIVIKVDAPPGVSEQQFKTYFESEEFKRKIYEYYNQKAKELGQRK